VPRSRRDVIAAPALPALALGLCAPALLRAGQAGLAAVGVALVAGVLGARRPAPLLAAAVCVLVGAGWSGHRLAVLDRDLLRGRIGTSVHGIAVVTGTPSTGPFGTSAIASFMGSDVELRARERLTTGERLEVSGRLRAPGPPGADGFDEREWLGRQGVHEVLAASDVHRLGTRGGVYGAVDRLREGTRRALAASGSDDAGRVVEGILLGGAGQLSEASRDDFRRSGLQHILAVSGGNVALLVAAVLMAAWLAGLSRALAQGLALPVVLAYALVVGPGASVVRAATFGCVASLAWLAGRPAHRWHLLAVAAAVVSASDPYAVLEPGFQLSFAAVAAIFELAPALRRRLDGVPFPRRLRQPAAISIACSLATAPIAWWHFGRASLGGSVPANLLALPALAPLLWLALAAALLWPFAPAATVSLDLAARVLGTYLLHVASAGAWLDRHLGLRALGAVTALAGLGWCLRAQRPGPAAMAGAAAAAVAASALLPWPHGGSRPAPRALRLTVLDVGQGSAALLEAPGGAAVLVDAGPAQADVAGQLRRMGVRRLDLLVLSHPQADHVGGAAAVLGSLSVGRVLDPRIPSDERDELAALAAARARHVPVAVARAGEGYRAGGIVLRVLGPRGLVPGADPNDEAVVVEAVQGSCRMLLPADAESPMLLPEIDGRDSVLVVSHHGSADPGLPQLLDRLRPSLAVISVGARNRYGHPAPATLAALAAARVPVRRTDRGGRVTVECPRPRAPP
jgi:competence protein ComEC